MPLYRTNSDRGLWKKYRKEQPQHFHKPCYLDTKKPQVSKLTYDRIVSNAKCTIYLHVYSNVLSSVPGLITV